MRRVLKYVWEYKILVIIPTIAMLLNIGLDMLNPYYSRIMIDNVIMNKEKNMLATVIFGIGFVTISRAILGYTREFTLDYLSSRVNINLKRDLFNHIQSLSFSYFDSMNTGELMSRIGEDVDNVWRSISFGVALMVEQAIYLIVATGILFYISWELTLITLAIVPFILYFAMKLEKKEGKAFENISDHIAVLNTTAQENISGVRLVKAFARERHEILKFLGLNNKNYELSMAQTKVWGDYFPIIEFLSNIASLLVVCVGGLFVINESLSLGTLVAFNAYVWMLIWPMRMLGWLTNVVAQSRASAKKIFKIIDTKPQITDKEDAVHLEDVKGNVVIKNVSFKYNDNYVLKDINIDVKAGSTIAIMGTTGAGKSSIINLIGRYYDVTEGEVLVDGHNVKDICIEDLRKKMSVVAQDTFLFSEKIIENVKMGKEDATMEEVIKACEDACAHEFITELDEGYDTLVGERGIGLSGGQKQRISIARALLRDASILVLDDSTSALDMETEYKLLKNLNNRTKKATTFIIAHRISAVKNADEILYVENGSIVERGTHEELLKLRGKYYEIYCEQFKDFEDVECEVI